MTLNEYQARAMSTCLPTCDNESYMLLNLVGEVGELSGKIAKHIRKGHFDIKDNVLQGKWESVDDATACMEDLKSEAGDILWQLAGFCKKMGWPLEEVAQCNLDKLANRKKQGTIISHTDH